MRLFGAAVVASVLGTAIGLVARQPSCAAAGDVQFVCGQDAPEDLVVIPGNQWVVAGAYAGQGGISLIRVSDRTSTRAYPTSTPAVRFDAKAYAGCPGPPDAKAFTTHGLSIQPGSNDVHRLYVVGHGARESIEVFDVDARRSPPVLAWIGCAIAPDKVGLNSVRWLADGGFIATNFLGRGGDGSEQRRMMAGEKNGQLWEWHTVSGWQMIPGSEAAGANGIELSDDGRWLYVAAWGTQSFFRLSRGQAKPTRDEIPLGFRVDNLRWARDGTLLAAGQGGAPGALVTVVVKIDPKTLTVKEVLRRPNLESFGAGTVAVEVGDQLWVGSFRGDRIALFKP